MGDDAMAPVSGAINGPGWAVPLTERVLSRLPGSRFAWVVVWAMVPWVNLAVVVAFEAAEWRGSGVPLVEVLNRAAVSCAVLLSLWGVKKISEEVPRLRTALAEVVDQDPPGIGGLFRGIGSTLAPLLLLAAVAVALPADEALRSDRMAALIQAVTWLAFGIPLCTALWIYVLLQIGLNRLGRGHLTIQAYRGDRSLGLRPVGSLAFTGFWMLFGTVGPVVLTGFSDVATVVIGISVLVAGAGLFFLSLRRVHRQMVAVKRRELDRSRDLYMQAYQRIRDETTLETLQQQVGLLNAAEALEQRAERIHEWPFDDAMVVRVVTIASSVVAVIIARVILDPIGL